MHYILALWREKEKSFRYDSHIFAANFSYFESGFMGVFQIGRWHQPRSYYPLTFQDLIHPALDVKLYPLFFICFWGFSRESSRHSLFESGCISYPIQDLYLAQITIVLTRRNTLFEAQKRQVPIARIYLYLKALPEPVENS